jgi:hypothetical protein
VSNDNLVCLWRYMTCRLKSDRKLVRKRLETHIPSASTSPICVLNFCHDPCPSAQGSPCANAGERLSIPQHNQFISPAKRTWRGGRRGQNGVSWGAGVLGGIDKRRRPLGLQRAGLWKRRGGDSNSRNLAVNRFSKPAHSAALPPLQVRDRNHIRSGHCRQNCGFSRRCGFGSAAEDCPAPRGPVARVPASTRWAARCTDWSACVS